MKVEGKTRTQTNCPRILRCAWAQGGRGRMERLVRVPYSLYPGYGNTLPLGQPGLSEHKQPDWRHNNGPPAFLARPGLLVPSNASDYCKDGEDEERKALSGPPEASQPPLPPPTPRSEEDQREELRQQEELGEEDASSPRERKSKQAQGDASEPLRKPNFQVSFLFPRLSPLFPFFHFWRNESRIFSRKHVFYMSYVYFLEPKYGYFHCKDCKTRWESAYVWCISGTNKVYFKQLCCKCQKSFNPYRVEAIQCQDSKEEKDIGDGVTCSKSRCSCLQKKRHIDLRRPHRQELCGRCKDKRFSCGNIYSFKCIM
ncbi:hypothetical protein E2I00_004454 [Balaenoptera physalus]|uniref:3CxxC-type domain-containing protein n=1 Tax=Balaenoptera physalus TaxID=9770 RepID=A0A643BPM0_BALPH|nr:hypothetical protein E2I00_004454 [Balaenoptera physalus]